MVAVGGQMFCVVGNGRLESRLTRKLESLRYILSAFRIQAGIFVGPKIFYVKNNQSGNTAGEPAGGAANGGQFYDGNHRSGVVGGGTGAGAQSVHVGGPVHARAHE